MFIQTDYSLLSSVLTYESGVKIVKEAGHKKVVLCDDNLSATIKFYKAAKSAGLEPVIAVQAVFEGVKYLFVALNKMGYSMLTKAESIGYTADIFQNENIVAIAIDIIEGGATIQSEFGSYKKELTDLDCAINQLIAAQTTILPIRIANAETEKDFFRLASLKAIGDKETFEGVVAYDNIAVNTIMLPEEITPDLQKILSQTVNDYEFGNPKPPSFKFGEEVGSKFGLTNPNNDELFEAICWVGLKMRFPDGIPQEYLDRLVFEMNVIKKMQFAGYFLIVWDFIKESRKMGVAVGPGRGSAAGSLVAYAMKITNLDPLKYNLLFERFLNPDRVSFPDVDIDFSKENRGKVLDYVINKYGRESVSQVITFGTLAAKNAVRDAARIVSAPLALADKIAKSIPEEIGINLKESYKNEELQKFIENDFFAKKVWDKAVSVEGYKKSQGVHAAGLVISNDPIYNRAPLYVVNDTQVVGYEGSYLEDVNLVKYDFLGLKTLDVIVDTLAMIEKRLNVKIDIETINLEDKETLINIAKGETSGIFQIESSGMQDLNQRLKPTSFEDLIAVLALYRPGPMEAGMLESFINRKHGREKIDYFFSDMEELLKPILEPTYGLIVYQEQVMQIVQAIAGFSLGEADLVRRAMGKKKLEEMIKISADFVQRAVERGFKENEAKQLFDLIEKFAGYGFNKSHSAAYAKISFQTAWLKAHYPEYFMAALINADMDDKDKLSKYFSECKRMGIEITKPNVKLCSEKFEVIDNNVIAFGLSCIKSVGGTLNSLLAGVKAMPNTDIKTLFKFLQRDIKSEIIAVEKKIVAIDKKIVTTEKRYQDRYNQVSAIKDQQAMSQREAGFIAGLEIETVNMQNLISEKESLVIELQKLQTENSSDLQKVNKAVIVGLAEVGAFECFGITRKDMLDNIEDFINPKNIDSIVFSGTEISLAQKIEMENEKLGFIVSDIYKQEQRNLLETIEIPEDMPIGVLLSKETKKKKNGQEYLNIKVMLPDSNIFEGTDFNNICKNIEIGSLCSFLLRVNGRYVNIAKVSLLNEKIISEYPIKKTVKKMNVLEDIKQEEIIKYDRIEVYDLNGSLIAIFSRKGY